MLFHTRTALLAGLLVAAMSAVTQAGEIIGFSWHSGVASLAATAVNPPPSPNNDNVVGSSPNVQWVTQKDYFAIGPVDVVFDVRDTGGVTEYHIIEGVQNNTGVDWTAYHIELGFGYDAGFVKSTVGDGLDFDAPDYDSDLDFNPSPGFFPIANVISEDDILATGGIMTYPNFAGYFHFTVDVPDGIDSFTVRQSPIPEPATMALVGAGVLCGLRRRRTA